MKSRLAPVLLGVLVLVMGVLSETASAQVLRPVVGRERMHDVVGGEDLYTIAVKYGLAIEHVAWANGLPVDSLNVKVGKRLLIPRRILPSNPPENGIVVNLAERGAFLFRDARFDKFYPVAIGQPGFETPRGSFKIISRVENPTWLPPEWAGLGEISVPPGPSNPLGDRWIGTSADGVGMHATLEPLSIGQAASHGCMRMYPHSVRELFEKVKVGWPIRLEYETVKLGYEPDSGKVYVVHYPDVYGIADPMTEAARLAAEAGIDSLLDEPALKKILAGPRGVPQHTLGADVVVSVNDQPLALTVPAVYKDGRLLVPAEVASAVGLQVQWDPTSRSVKLTSRKGMEAVIPLLQKVLANTTETTAPEEQLVAYRYQGRTLLPARFLLKHFAIPHKWSVSSKSKTLHLYN